MQSTKNEGIKIPSSRHVTYKLCQLINERGSWMSRADAISFFEGKNYTLTHALEFLRKMIYNGILQSSGYTYNITPEMRKYLDLAHGTDDKKSVDVTTHYLADFKPLSAQYINSLKSSIRRADTEPLREMSFICGGISMSPFRDANK